MSEKQKAENKNRGGRLTPSELPVDGSLGLLALGAVGIDAWRKKRNEAKITPKPDQQK